MLGKLPLLSLVSWALLIAGTAFAAEPTPTYSPPVLLHSEILLTPFETAGSGLAPELQLVVTIDTRGRVSFVEVKNIHPSSEFDELFKEVTEQSISSWRYAPALANGEAVEATLEWSVKFQAKSGQKSFLPSDPGFLPRLGTHQGLRTQRLSKQQRVNILQRYVEVAEQQLDSEHRQRYDSNRFVVISDAPTADTAKAIAGNLEAIFNILEGLLGNQIPLQPEGYKIVAYVFANKDSLRKVRRELQVRPWAEGFYAAPGLMIFHLQVQTTEFLQQLMIHEATHAFMDRHLTRHGTLVPPWITEGFAEYMGNSQIKKGTLLPGKTLKSHFALSHYGGAYRRQTNSGNQLEETKSLLRQKKGLTVEELVDGGDSLFYGEKYNLYYPTSWLFVHFLRHGDPQWEGDQFPRLMLYLSEGYPGRDALENVYGQQLTDFEAPFLDYVKKF
ncbi:MAG: energy transducer TonB [Deltaproteobacteria bacterium]|nr:energy transducer TonB [Deltaproteobacteria bacterium]